MDRLPSPPIEIDITPPRPSQRRDGSGSSLGVSSLLPKGAVSRLGTSLTPVESKTDFTKRLERELGSMTMDQARSVDEVGPSHAARATSGTARTLYQGPGGLTWSLDDNPGDDAHLRDGSVGREMLNTEGYEEDMDDLEANERGLDGAGNGDAVPGLMSPQHQGVKRLHSVRSPQMAAAANTRARLVSPVGGINYEVMAGAAAANSQLGGATAAGALPCRPRKLFTMSYYNAVREYLTQCMANGVKKPDLSRLSQLSGDRGEQPALKCIKGRGELHRLYNAAMLATEANEARHNSGQLELGDSAVLFAMPLSKVVSEHMPAYAKAFKVLVVLLHPGCNEGIVASEIDLERVGLAATVHMSRVKAGIQSCCCWMRGVVAVCLRYFAWSELDWHPL